MTGKQNREWQDKKDTLELSFTVLPHILLKEIVIFQSGVTVSFYQGFSIFKSLFLLANSFGQEVPFLYQQWVG
jgi:hypothetical protein